MLLLLPVKLWVQLDEQVPVGIVGAAMARQAGPLQPRFQSRA